MGLPVPVHSPDKILCIRRKNLCQAEKPKGEDATSLNNDGVTFLTSIIKALASISLENILFWLDAKHT